MSERSNIVQLIADLGFTDLESEIYVFLLQYSPATGYKIAKSIGRSFTNTYKALAALQAKGAILVDESESKLSRAVPVEELLDQLERRFRSQRQATLDAVKELPSCAGDNRIYQLNTVEQVYERAHQMLASAEERVLIELFPEPLIALKTAVEETAKRGIHVAARVYQGEELAGPMMIQSPFGAENLKKWPTHWMGVYVDGRQFLMGHISRDGKQVLQAFWSANFYLARSLYSHVNSDLHHYAFHAKLKTATSVDELRAEYDRLQTQFPIGGDLGFRDFLNHFPDNTKSPDKT